MVEDTKSKHEEEPMNEYSWIDKLIPKDKIVKFFIQFNWVSEYGWQPVFFVLLEPMPRDDYTQ